MAILRAGVAIPEKVLHPEETVLDVAVGGLSSGTFPLLLVTDRRVILTRDQPWRRWRILRETPVAEVVGAEVDSRLLGGRLRVRLRQDKDIVLKLGSLQRPKEVAALIRRLVSGGGSTRCAQPWRRGRVPLQRVSRARGALAETRCRARPRR